MNSIHSVIELKRSGRFDQALLDLDSCHIAQAERLTAQLLRVELLERLGRYDQSFALATALSRSKELTTAQRSVCEYVFGRISLENGETDAAIAHLQRAVSFANEGKNLTALCSAQIALLLIVSDRSGPETASPLLKELRFNAIRHGDPQTLAALHLFVGEMEAKCGHLNSAKRHAALAQRMLATSGNAWLEAVAENLNLALSILRSDVDSGLKHGLRALELARESGTASTIRACLGNLGNLYHVLGDFERAVDYFNQARAALPSEGERNNATLDSLARTRMDQNRLDDCARLLDQIRGSIRAESDWRLYAHRYAKLTETQLLARQGDMSRALASNESVMLLAKQVGDELLASRTLLLGAELLQFAGQPSESLKALSIALSRLPVDSPDLYASYERAVAIGLAFAGNLAAARHHYERAKLIYESLSSAPDLVDLARSWSTVTSPGSSLADASSGRFSSESIRPRTSLLHDIASIMLHAGRPELVAREIVDLLGTTDCVEYATALARAADGSVEPLAHAGRPRDQPPPDREQSLAIGSARERDIEVLVVPKPDLESISTVNAVVLLLATLHDLERARAEREEHAMLWPVDELPADEEGAVAVGHMREMLSFARKIANANVNVLITGESGTGKEVLARAIHAHSSRARKPFIPFNCTAVPRELIESQLFGYRRGAFTGADRDNPGVIRSARDGTLFLDEIGELGLDLQPKLLRFLESGEICPLGESTPPVVNVRVLAATNADLETLVREGRFREDLFYRLNVIRLSIKPLRDRRDEIPSLVTYFLMRAAEEFRKSHIRLAEEAIERLVLYAWPGNIRQLQNEIRRMVALAEPNTVLGPALLSSDILRETTAAAASRAPAARSEIAVPLTEKLHPTLSRVEREMIKVALRENQGRLDATARALGISRKGLYLKRQRLGL